MKDKPNKTGCPFLQGKTATAMKVAKKLGWPIKTFKLSGSNLPPSGSQNKTRSGEK